VRFIDTNVLLRHLVDGSADQRERSTALLAAIESGREQGIVSQLVIFETIFTLQQYYRLSLPEVRQVLLPVLELPLLHLADKAMFADALALAIERNIPFQDAFNVMFMTDRELTEIYSWDRDFDRIDGIARIDPGS
jgi:uncharacterized protein